MSRRPPNVVRLTPPGRGAVATVLVTGAGAVATVDGLFRARGGRRLAESPADAVVVGRFGDSQGAAEQIVARRVSDDEVLLHCHGGTAAVARIESLLADRGVVPRDWPAWAADAHADPLQAEALVALAKATTEHTAGILLDQYQGALRRELGEVRAILEIERPSASGPHPDPLPQGEATLRIDRLLARGSLGLHLTEPWNVVLAGPPNSGKSSLMNAILGYARAIVHASPGTTRDVLTAETSFDGWPIRLVDTAGLRVSDHPVEAEGVRRARQQLETADLVLLVFDGTQPFAEQASRVRACTHGEQESRVRACTHGVDLGSDLENAEGRENIGTYHSPGACEHAPYSPGACEHAPYLPGAQAADVLVVHNKSDLRSAPGDRPEGVSTSAVTSDGVPQLLRAITDRLVPDPPSPGDAVPWTSRHVEALVAARAALDAGRAAEAAARLAALQARDA